LNSGEEVECVVLDINKEKQEISLGLKQLKTNPWAVAAQKYPPGTIVTTRVTSLTSYGAFVEIEPGIDGLVHISDLSWTKKFSHPSDILQKGQELKCLVLDVDEEKHRVSLGIKQMTEDPWVKAIPEKYIPGQIVRGRVTKLTNFGVFIELEPDLEGLLHISELADHKIGSPQEVVSVEEELEIKILRVDNDSRKIGLSLRRVKWAAEDQEKQDEAAGGQKAPSGEQVARRGGLDGSLMPGGFSLSDEPKPVVAETQPEQAEVAEPQPEPAEESSEPAAETQPEQAEETQPEQAEETQPEPAAESSEQAEESQPEPAEVEQADEASPESVEVKADEQAPESEEASSEPDSQDEPAAEETQA
jgi:small subunit ribosomal protein S1